MNLILPCFDRSSSSNFPIAKEKGRKIRKGPGVNPDQGQGPDQEAGLELGPDQDHQIATEKGISKNSFTTGDSFLLCQKKLEFTFRILALYLL